MFCTNCGAKLDEGQRFCSNCGTPVQTFTPKAAEPAPAPESAQAPVYTPAEPTVPPVPPVPPVQPQSGKPARPKKKGKGWLVAILALILVAAAAFAVLRWNTVSAFAGNFIAKTFSDPEEYYQRVEKNSIRSMLDAAEEGDGLFDLYQEAAQTRAAGGTQYMEEKLQLSLDTAVLGDDLLDLIEDEAGVDVSWFRNVGMYVSAATEDSRVGGTVIAFLNDTDIIDADVVIDTDDGAFYFGVPQLSDKLAELNMEDMGYEGYADALAASQELTALLTDRELMSTLVERYSEIIVKDLTKVDKGAQELSAGDLSGKYTALEVTIDGKAQLKIAKDVLNKLKFDAEFEKLAIAYFKAQAMSEAEANEAFDVEVLDWINKTLDELEGTDASELKNEIRMTVYVDALGKVCGREIELLEDGEETGFYSYALVRKGLDYGARLMLRQTDEWGDYREDNSYTVNGGGKLSLKGELDGSFELFVKSISGLEAVQQTVDIKAADLEAQAALKNGDMSFTLTVVPTQELYDLALEDAGTPAEAEKLVRSLSIVYSGEIKSGNAGVVLALRSDGSELAAMSVDAYRVAPFDIPATDDAVDVNAWVYTMDYSKLQDILKKLTDAGMPASLLGNVGDYL